MKRFVQNLLYCGWEEWDSLEKSHFTFGNIHYRFTLPSGLYFDCIAQSLEVAQLERNKWLRGILFEN